MNDVLNYYIYINDNILKVNNMQHIVIVFKAFKCHDLLRKSDRK